MLFRILDNVSAVSARYICGQICGIPSIVEEHKYFTHIFAISLILNSDTTPCLYRPMHLTGTTLGVLFSKKSTMRVHCQNQKGVLQFV